jgi:DNA-binding transcriptional MocR family regulator
VVPGTRVASVRRTAAELGVSTATVAAAMAELRRRGLVVARPSGLPCAPRSSGRRCPRARATW